MGHQRRAQRQSSRLRNQIRATAAGRRPTTAQRAQASRPARSVSFDERMEIRDRNAAVRSQEIAGIRTQRTAQRVRAAGKTPDMQRIFDIESTKIAQGGSRGSIVPGSGSTRASRQRAAIQNVAAEITGGITAQGLQNVGRNTAGPRPENLPPELQDRTAPNWRERFAAWVARQDENADTLIERQRQGLTGGPTVNVGGRELSAGEFVQQGLENADLPISPILKVGNKLLKSSEEILRLNLRKQKIQSIVNQFTEADNIVKSTPKSRVESFKKNFGSTPKEGLTPAGVERLRRMESYAKIGGAPTPQAIINPKKEALVKRIFEKIFKTTQRIETTNLQTGQRSLVEQTRFSPLKTTAVAVAAGTGIGLNIWSEWYRRDNGIGALQAAKIHARENFEATRDPTILKEINAQLEAALNPSLMENMGRFVPFLGAIINAAQGSKWIAQAFAIENRIDEDMYEKVRLQDQGIATGIFATDRDIQREIDRQAKEDETESYNANQLFWEERRRQANDNERIADMNALAEQAAFWRDQAERTFKREEEEREKIAEFWFEYRKRVMRLEEGNAPSKLNFGGIV